MLEIQWKIHIISSIHLLCVRRKSFCIKKKKEQEEKMGVVAIGMIVMSRKIMISRNDIFI